MGASGAFSDPSCTKTNHHQRMPLPRIQAFEFNDKAWAPAVLRDTIVESLSRTLSWGKILSGLTAPLASFLEEAGTNEILDIGSGAGAPAAILARALTAAGRPTRFTLTDLYPRVPVWEKLVQEQPDAICYVASSVDATAIDTQLSRGKARAIINVLHHLPPELAGSVLRDAVHSRAPIFVAEGFERNPLRFAAFAPFGLPALALSPLLSRDRRLSRAFLTWATPTALLCSVWDGLVSTLRVYSEAELRSMVGDDSGYRWQYGNFTWVPFGRGYYFYGVPERR
jgi:hypothetical protein